MENRIKKFGRPSKYTDELPFKLIQFFSKPLFRKEIVATIHFKNGGSKDEYGYLPNDPPYFSAFCRENDITQSIFDMWVDEKSKYFKPDLFVAYKEAKELQKEFILNNSMAQRTNCSMSIFLLKNIAGMRDDYGLKGEGFGKNEYHYTIIKSSLPEQKENSETRLKEQLQVNS